MAEYQAVCKYCGYSSSWRDSIADAVSQLTSWSCSNNPQGDKHVPLDQVEKRD